MISQTSKSQLFHTAFCMFLLHLVAVVGVCNGAPVASNGGATTAFELLFQSAFAPLASFFSPAPGTPTSYHEHISPIIALNKKSSGNQNDDEFHILPMPDNGKQIRFTTTTTTISSKKDGNSLDEVHILPIKEDFELPASEQGKSSSSGHGDHLQQKMPFNTESGLYQRLKNLGSSFQRLRGVRAHFEGGLWDDDVDAWMGEKHRLMLEL